MTNAELTEAVITTSVRLEAIDERAARIESTLDRLVTANEDRRVEMASLVAQASGHADRARTAAASRPGILVAASAAGVAVGEVLRVMFGS